jgi:membrane protein
MKSEIPQNHELIEEISTDKEHFLARKLREYLQKKTIRGFKGLSFYEVGRYFLRSIFMENISLSASSLSFNFFLALFPALLFLLTLIAYLPFHGMKTQLIEQLSLILPERTYEEISQTILEILRKQNSSLLSFGFLLTIYFASNAFHILINTFNRRLAGTDMRAKQNWFIIRARAIFLTFLLTVLIILFLAIVTVSVQIETYMIENDWPLVSLYSFLIVLIEYLLVAAVFVFTISSIYFFAPSKTERWTFFSIGALLAGALSIIATFGFTLYVNNFDSYNKVYGSIGAIIALMVLIYINTFSMIIGFELNTSIDKAEIARVRIKKKQISSQQLPSDNIR